MCHGRAMRFCQHLRKTARILPLPGLEAENSRVSSGLRKNHYISQVSVTSSKLYPTNSSPRQARAFPLSLLITLLGGAAYHLLAPSKPDGVLNQQSFSPYTIIAREAISPSSVILTVAPRASGIAQPRPVLDSSLGSHKLWSVEFKQPEVQIARHYTPLPSLAGDDPSNGCMRFYIRAVQGGEMSTYLARQPVGQIVWLRGPHASFDVRKRLGSRTRLAFIAGGTGLAPGLQAARAVLDAADDSTVSLLWAVRDSEEVHVRTPDSTSWWRPWAWRTPRAWPSDIDNLTHIAKHIQALKAQYGDRVDILYAADSEGAYFRARDLYGALNAPRLSKPSKATLNCPMHDQSAHRLASEFDDAATASCRCSATDAHPGKNLLIVSGPDGLVSHFVGAKAWQGGRLTQGPVGGLVGQLWRRWPHLSDEWLVLKL